MGKRKVYPFLFWYLKRLPAGGIMEKHQYIDEKKVARITGRAIPTLRNDRHKGRGIPYIKIGRSVRYAFNDVIDFMESRKILTDDLKS